MIPEAHVLSKLQRIELNGQREACIVVNRFKEFRHVVYHVSVSVPCASNDSHYR